MTLKEILNLHLIGTRRYGPCRTVTYCGGCRRFTIHEYLPVSGRDEYETIPDDLLPLRTVSDKPYFLRCEECRLAISAGDGSRPYFFRTCDKTIEQLLDDHYPDLPARYQREVHLDWLIRENPQAMTNAEQEEWLRSVLGAARYECSQVAENILKYPMYLSRWNTYRFLALVWVFILVWNIASHYWGRWLFPEWFPQNIANNVAILLFLCCVGGLQDLCLSMQRWRNYTKYCLYPRLAAALAVCPPEIDDLQVALDRFCEQTPELAKRGWTLCVQPILELIPKVKPSSAVPSFRQLVRKGFAEPESFEYNGSVP